MASQSFDIPPLRYDALIDWDKRLANEAPLFRALFARHRVQRVADQGNVELINLTVHEGRARVSSSCT